MARGGAGAVRPALPAPRRGGSTIPRTCGRRRSRPSGRCWRRRGAAPGVVAAIGIANQRETVIVWERSTGRPIHHAIVWQDRRTAGECTALRNEGHEALVSERTGLVLDPYFSATKIAWIPRSGGWGAGAGGGGRACLRHGGQLPPVAADRRPRARDRRDQCLADLTLRSSHWRLGPGPARSLPHPRLASARGARFGRRLRGFRARSFRWRDPDRGGSQATQQAATLGRAASSRA